MEQSKKVKGREFLFKLALALGRTVHELETTMTHQELLEWHEYYNVEPFTADRTEMQLATMSFLISTSNGGKSDIKDFTLSNKQHTTPKTTKPTKGFVQSFIL